LDADSEGHEGKFYVWDAAQVEALLTPDELAVFARRFGIDGPPNFEGAWHLHIHRSVDDIATELGIAPSVVEERLASAQRKLLEERNRRVRPGLDDKILTAWNARAISGMAVAGRVLQQSELTRSAFEALDFLRRSVVRDGRLLAVYKDGEARFPAYLDDYAFLIDALLETLQTRWRNEDLELATRLADALLAHFEDRDNGGFFFTADDHEQLIHRSKSFADEALPSGNAIAAQTLTRLGLLLGETRYLDAAARALRAAW